MALVGMLQPALEQQGSQSGLFPRSTGSCWPERGRDFSTPESAGAQVADGTSRGIQAEEVTDAVIAGSQQREILQEVVGGPA
jgi:hypothetical protein